jgi:hypothetical protein
MKPRLLILLIGFCFGTMSVFSQSNLTGIYSGDGNEFLLTFKKSKDNQVRFTATYSKASQLALSNGWKNGDLKFEGKLLNENALEVKYYQMRAANDVCGPVKIITIDGPFRASLKTVKVDEHKSKRIIQFVFPDYYLNPETCRWVAHGYDKEVYFSKIDRQ